MLALESSGGTPVDNRFPVAIARGSHPFPSRTRKLSLSAPMVLGERSPGRVGRRRFSRTKSASPTGRRSSAFSGDRRPTDRRISARRIVVHVRRPSRRPRREPGSPARGPRRGRAASRVGAAAPAANPPAPNLVLEPAPSRRASKSGGTWPAASRPVGPGAAVIAPSARAGERAAIARAAPGHKRSSSGRPPGRVADEQPRRATRPEPRTEAERRAGRGARPAGAAQTGRPERRAPEDRAAPDRAMGRRRVDPGRSRRRRRRGRRRARPRRETTIDPEVLARGARIAAADPRSAPNGSRNASPLRRRRSTASASTTPGGWSRPVVRELPGIAAGHEISGLANYRMGRWREAAASLEQARHAASRPCAVAGARRLLPGR